MLKMTRYDHSMVKTATKNGILTKDVNVVISKLAEISKDYDKLELQLMYLMAPDKETILDGFRKIIRKHA